MIPIIFWPQNLADGAVELQVAAPSVGQELKPLAMTKFHPAAFHKARQLLPVS